MDNSSMTKEFTDWHRAVFEFHKHINRPRPQEPKNLDVESMNTRIAYMEEEISELTSAWSVSDREGQVDALVDLIYYAIGTAIEMGVDLRPVFREVHRANMDKVPDPKDYKNCIKPPGWCAPNIRMAIEKGNVYAKV